MGFAISGLKSGVTGWFTGRKDELTPGAKVNIVRKLDGPARIVDPGRERFALEEKEPEVPLAKAKQPSLLKNLASALFSTWGKKVSAASQRDKLEHPFRDLSLHSYLQQEVHVDGYRLLKDGTMQLIETNQPSAIGGDLVGGNNSLVLPVQKKGRKLIVGNSWDKPVYFKIAGEPGSKAARKAKHQAPKK